jgi:hypothetical protein
MREALARRKVTLATVQDNREQACRAFRSHVGKVQTVKQKLFAVRRIAKRCHGQ